jgi:hypothetical protein
MPTINTYTDLEEYYKRYLNYECADSHQFLFYSRQTVFPGRCQKAREYVEKMKQFIKRAREEDKDSIPRDKELLEERIANEEHKNVYPLLNHDFNYTNMIKKQYTPYALDITNRPTMSGMMDGITNNIKYVRALLNDPLPNETSVAGKTDAVIETPERRDIIERTRAEDNKLPYPSFRKDYPECLYPTTGKHASSYFVKVGQCPTSIKTKAVCTGRGYTWSEIPNPPPEATDFMEPKSAQEADGKTTSRAADVPPPPRPPPDGTCFKPKFIYVNNRAKGFAQMDGIVVSGLGDLREIAPDRLYSIMSGQSIDGAGILPCVDETFQGSMNDTQGIHSVPVIEDTFHSRMTLLLVVAFLFVFLYLIQRRR